jgi:hypothetical protein
MAAPWLDDMNGIAIDRRVSMVPSWVALMWALAYVVLFGIALFSISWSFGDTVALMQKAARLDWRATIADAFGSGVEYRPFFTLAIKLFYEVVGARAWFYQALVLLQFAIVLGVILWLCRPLGGQRAFAACLAVSCFCALHSTRILFGFWPLNQHSGVLVLMLIAIALAFRDETRSYDWVFGPLALAAMFGLELGLLFAPVVVVLWLAGAPGVGRRAAMSVMLATGIYVAIRLGLGSDGGMPASHNENGFGFSMLAPERVRAEFGDPPFLLWMYNVASTFLTVVLSEPRDGVFSFVESLLARDMESWRWFHVGLSALTSALIAVGLLVRRSASSGLPRDRLVVALGLALMMFGSGLGFLYTRDRIALSAGVGYALLLYVAVVSLMERLPASGWTRRLASGAMVVLAAAWVVRSGETFLQLRDTAWDYHLEWTARFTEKGGATEERTEVFTALEKEALRQTPADPRLDPAWTYALFERRFARSPEAR